VWRICRGCLPTRVRLLDKGVQCPTNCVSCPSNHEDLAHIFFYCPFDVHVWQLAGLWGTIHHAMSSSNSAIDVIFMLLETLYVKLNQRLISLFWSLWKHQNLRVWDDVREVGVMVVERTKNMVVDWQLGNFTAATKPTSPHQVHQPIKGGSSSAVGNYAFVNVRLAATFAG
jgi:hypothetical protein